MSGISRTESQNNALYAPRESNPLLSLWPKNFSGIITQANAYANAFQVVEAYNMNIFEYDAVSVYTKIEHIRMLQNSGKLSTPQRTAEPLP